MTHLGTVVTVENNRYAVVFGHKTDMLSPSDSSKYGGLLPGVLYPFPSQESRTSV